MKGIWGGLLNIVGIGSLIFVLASGFISSSQGSGGTVNLINQTVNDPVTRQHVVDMQLASMFLTPMLNVGGHYVSMDAMTVLIVLFISMGILWIIALLFKPGMIYLIPIFLLAFVMVAIMWQGYWLEKYLDAGQELGASRDTLLDNLKTSGEVISTPILLVLNIIAAVFIFARFYYILPGL